MMRRDRWLLGELGTALPEPLGRAPVAFIVLLTALGWSVLGEDFLTRAIRGMGVFTAVLIVEVLLRAALGVRRASRASSAANSHLPIQRPGSDRGSEHDGNRQ